MTATPQRIQLRRTKGWRKPEGCIVVARPSKWGNPFTVSGAREAGMIGDDDMLRIVCVATFRAWLRGDSDVQYQNGVTRRQQILHFLPELRGHDLACWCPLDFPCHADVLLRLANQ